MKKVAVVGISGVGKSTLITAVGAVAPLVHLQASELLKSAIARQSAIPTSEELRTGAVLDNQKMLIAEYNRKIASVEDLVIFDGHTIVDGANGLVEVPSEVFAALALDLMVFLQADPQLIVERRAQDSSRVRPSRSLAEVTLHQDRAREHARHVSRATGVPLRLVENDEGKAALLALIKSGL